MNRLLIAASVAWAAVICGCSSDGGAGPASSPFNPFGTEPAMATGAEPTVSGLDTPSGTSGRSIPELCAIDCARIEAACPGTQSPDCVASCSDAPSIAPACMDLFQAYFACISTANIVCNGGGSGSIDIPACGNTAAAVTACLNQNRTA